MSEDEEGKVLLVNGAATRKESEKEVELFARKMRKSLGDKRNELAPEHIDELLRLAAVFEGGPYSQVFETKDFGYRKITVERPLRLNFQASEERLERLSGESGWMNLAISRKKGPAAEEIAAGKKTQTDILAALRTLDATQMWKNRDEFEGALQTALTHAGQRPGAPVKKAILAALSERDETADICPDSKGDPEADPELRDSENVPLKQDVNDFFEREVRPHVPDVWINTTVRDHKDNQIGKVGYEINFNRYFYRYEPPRRLVEIEADIKELETEILEMLKEVTA